MISSPPSDLESFAACLVRGAALELYLTPKPGLVDVVDCGSHPDLTLHKMERSIFIIEEYLAELCRTLRAGEGLAAQKETGKRAEARMYKEIGTNTHKGYIFISGLLLAAWFKAAHPDQLSLRLAVADLARDFFTMEPSGATNGLSVRTRYRTGGVVSEALGGFPAMFEHAEPAFKEILADTGSFTTAAFAALARLMQVVEDSTALHRCGINGLDRLRRDGAHLEELIRGGRNFFPYLTALNAHYRGMKLTMGGCADMLALTLGYVSATGALDAEVTQGKALTGSLTS